MKKALALIGLFAVLTAAGCGSNSADNNASESTPVLQSAVSEDGVDSIADLSEESQKESNAPSAEESQPTTESTAPVLDEESYVYKETEQQGVIGGYDNPMGTSNGFVHLQFSGMQGFRKWLSGNSKLYLTDENGDEVLLHNHQPTENARKILEGKTIYSPTFNVAIEDPWEITVEYSLGEDPTESVTVSYDVKGYKKDKTAYIFSYTYYTDKYTQMMSGGIVDFYKKTGKTYKDPQFRYTTTSMPIYDHMGQTFLETELHVADLSYRSFTTFIFKNVKVEIFTRDGCFNAEDFNNLGFIDMYCLADRPIV